MNINQVYQITIKGILNKRWENWFEGMTIQTNSDKTFLTGNIKDQAALYGLFNKLRDLRFTILSVYQLDDKGDIK